MVGYKTPNLEVEVQSLSLVPALNLRFSPIPSSGALHDPLAQMVEHTAFNRRVLSPSLRRITNIRM